jgi:hypothetical protein
MERAREKAREKAREEVREKVKEKAREEVREKVKERGEAQLPSRLFPFLSAVHMRDGWTRQPPRRSSELTSAA